MVGSEVLPEFQLLLIGGMCSAEVVQSLFKGQVVWVGDGVEVVWIVVGIVIRIQLGVVAAQSPFSRSSASALAMQLADVQAVTDSKE